ncbi:hypothetical protein EPN44_07560 [bacterium]|nr:MAG: hypothetical protein EPN44_07560 [bacterium]
MKAAVITDVEKIDIRELDLPTIRPHYALVRVAAATLCGTDLHQYGGKIKTPLPRIPGHDFSGVIEQIAPGHDSFREGDRVVVKPSFPCGTCEYCTRCDYGACEDKKLIGLHGDGCMAEYIVAPIANLIPLPQGVSFEAAANLEMFTVAMNTMKRIQPRLGEWVVVLGQGPIGLGQTRMASLSGARVIAVDVRREALEMARDFGADITLQSAECDVVAEVKKLTGVGADIVIECVGAKATVDLIFQLVRKEGRVANVGFQIGAATYDLIPIMLRSLTIYGIGGNGGRGQYETVIALTESGKIQPERLITHRMPLRDAAKAFSIAHRKSEPVLKVVLSPNTDLAGHP